jgi:hypothetical protein
MYKGKYLKYKKKYLDLDHWINMHGSGLETAKNSFFRALFGTNRNNIINLLEADSFLMSQIGPIPEIPTEITQEELKENIFWNNLFKKIISGIDVSIMDEYVKIYLKGNLGDPNSIENSGRYIDSMGTIKMLKENKIAIPATFDSLMDLEEFIRTNADKLAEINEKKREKEKKKNKQIEIKDKGESDVEKILETAKIIIYKPTVNILLE